MSPNQAYKIKVVAGVHKNAELIIATNTDYLVGSGDDCDIILVDRGVAKEHLCLSLSDTAVNLIKNGESIFVDGKPLYGSCIMLQDYQVVTVGEAHFAIGPANLDWPLLNPPVLEKAVEIPVSVELVPIKMSYRKPSRSRALKSMLQRQGDMLFEFFLKANKKMLVTLAVILFLFCSFWMDLIRSSGAQTSHSSETSATSEQQPRNSKSVLLSLISVMMQIRDKSMVGAGVKEPVVDVQKDRVIEPDPAQTMRDFLKANWGPGLTENQMDNNEVEFRGYDAANQMDLHLNLNKEDDGVLSAQGYTLSRKQRKEIVSQLGDVIRLKVAAAEDVENLCQKTMQKKKIQRPSARFDMNQKSVTLKGESTDHEMISQIEKIISQTIPDVAVDNQLKYLPGKLNIVGVSTSGVEHVKLSDGSKVFPGGKLQNGCIVVNIHQGKVKLDCHGSTIHYKIGDQS
jgi:hypothetical protein